MFKAASHGPGWPRPNVSERNGEAGLLCCLAGFDPVGANAVRRCAQRSGLQLSAEWTFETELSEVCDLLICDTDTHAGEKAWRATAGRIPVRAMATSDADVPDGLLLRKPFQQDKPDDLIRVLNEAARVHSARAYDRKWAHLGVAATVPAPRRWSLRAVLQMMHQWLLWSPDAPKPTAPAAPVSWTEAPHDDRAALAQPCADITAARDEPEDGPRAPVLQPHRQRQPGLNEAVVLVEDPVPARNIVLYTPMERVTAQPSQLVLHRPSAFTLVTEALEDNLLTALRRFRSLSQVAVIRFDDMPTICVTSATEMFYSLASLHGLYEVPAVKLTPARVTIARSSHQGRTEAQSYYQSGSQSYFVSLPGAPLKHLFWVATLRCGGDDEVDRYEDAHFRIRVMPEFALLPHERHHLTWANMLARQPVSLPILARATGHSRKDAAVFLAACDELGILERKGANVALGLPAIANDRSGEPEMSRSFARRLGFR